MRTTYRYNYTYVYGLGLVSQTDGSGNQTYMLPDGAKSDETLTDGSGTVSKSYKYDVFGAVRSSSGSGSTEFRYAAEQFDDTLNLIYLRARYYDQATGRFLSKDPAGGKLSSPVTQNKYVYGGNNPVNAGDPTGLVTNAQMDSWMANVPVTYWTPSSGYTSSFSAYSTSFNASKPAPMTVPGSTSVTSASRVAPAGTNAGSAGISRLMSIYNQYLPSNPRYAENCNHAKPDPPPTTDPNEVMAGWLFIAITMAPNEIALAAAFGTCGPPCFLAAEEILRPVMAAELAFGGYLIWDGTRERVR